MGAIQNVGTCRRHSLGPVVVTLSVWTFATGARLPWGLCLNALLLSAREALLSRLQSHPTTPRLSYHTRPTGNNSARNDPSPARRARRIILLVLPPFAIRTCREKFGELPGHDS